MNIQNITQKVKSNWIGAVLGGGAAFYVAKKHANISKGWHLALAVVVGVAVGVGVEGMISAKKSAPTAETVKK